MTISLMIPDNPPAVIGVEGGGGGAVLGHRWRRSAPHGARGANALPRAARAEAARGVIADRECDPDGPQYPYLPL